MPELLPRVAQALAFGKVARKPFANLEPDGQPWRSEVNNENGLLQ